MTAYEIISLFIGILALLSLNKTKRRKNPVFMRVCGVRRSLLITI